MHHSACTKQGLVTLLISSSPSLLIIMQCLWQESKFTHWVVVIIFQCWMASRDLLCHYFHSCLCCHYSHFCHCCHFCYYYCYFHWCHFCPLYHYCKFQTIANMFVLVYSVQWFVSHPKRLPALPWLVFEARAILTSVTHQVGLTIENIFFVNHDLITLKHIFY